jgi:hypothetical protein
MTKLDTMLHEMFDDITTITQSNVVPVLTVLQKQRLASGINMVEIALLNLEEQTDTRPTDKERKLGIRNLAQTQK